MKLNTAPARPPRRRPRLLNSVFDEVRELRTMFNRKADLMRLGALALAAAEIRFQILEGGR